MEPAVVIVSGHRVEAPGADAARFPPAAVPRVTAEVGAAFAEWGVGPGTTVVTGGARGADILGAEAGLARGARVVLCLALPPERFVARSVALPGTDWADRFHALLSRAKVTVLPDPPGDENVFSAANRWMVAYAREIDGGPVHALLVWDGRSAHGSGGTDDLLARLRAGEPAPPARGL